MNKYAHIQKNMIIMHKYFKIFLKKELEFYEVTPSEALVLLMLFDKTRKDLTDAGRTQDQLVHALHYDKSVMARTMQSLEEKELVTRSVNPNDNRSYLFTPTEKANSLKEPIFSVLSKWNDILLKDVKQIDVVNDAICQMSQNIENVFKEHH